MSSHCEFFMIITIPVCNLDIAFNILPPPQQTDAAPLAFLGSFELELEHQQASPPKVHTLFEM